MEKIKKLKYTGDLIEKINEIIDRLNEQPSYRDWCIQKAKEGRFKGMPIPEPQDTPEEYVDLHNPVTGTTYKVRKKSKYAGRRKKIEEDMEIVKEVNEILEDTPEERVVEDLGESLREWADEYGQDTPEQTEEWGEVNKDIWYMVGGKKYVNINGEEYVRTSDLEQLLEEREDKAREEGRRGELESLDKWYYERLGKEFNPFGYVLHEEIFKRLSKLTTK